MVYIPLNIGRRVYSLNIKQAGNVTSKNIPPKDDDELPKAGFELPNPGDEAAPNTGVEDSGDDDCPKTPVEVLPNIEPPVCEPKGLAAPKGLGANGLLA